MNIAQRSKFSIIVAAALLVGCQNTSPDSENYDRNSDMVPVITSVESLQVDMLNDLLNHDWTLLSAVDSRNKPVTALNNIKDTVTLSFTGDETNQYMGFTVGCNDMGGQFDVEDSVLFIDQIVSTTMYCDDLNKAEQLLGQAMSGSSQLSITPTKPTILTQITEADKTFIWQGKLTSDDQSIKEADIVYWEIDGTEQPCPDGTTRMCLEVRPIQYDSQGVKVKEGEWYLFSGEIVAYNHIKNSSQIVRLKRYEVEPSTSQVQMYSYIFDAVVENIVEN